MARAKKATAPALEVDEVEDDELEELDEDEVEDTAPAKSKDQEVTFGASQLATLASDKLGIKLDAKNLRVLLRKMARDGRLEREVKQGNRQRYNWSGPEDPEVKAILKALKSGELEKDKQEKLAALKERKAKKDAEAGKGKTTKSGKAKKVAAPVVEDDDDDEDFEDDDDE